MMNRRFAFQYEAVLGTSFDMQVTASSHTIARASCDRALAEVDRLEAILSGWSRTSELTRWLDAGEQSVEMSVELREVLLAADHWRKATNGAFDIRAVSSAGDSQPMSLDAIAKGYIVDRALVASIGADVTDVLINIGGDIRHRGKAAVVIGVTDPEDAADNALPIARVRLLNEAIATSGRYRRGNHLIDPLSGNPATHVASATVIASECMTADALSTAFCVLPVEESIALADATEGVACLIVPSGRPVVTNSAWQKRTIQ